MTYAPPYVRDRRASGFRGDPTGLSDHRRGFDPASLDESADSPELDDFVFPDDETDEA
jgi:hypothetical protein